MSPWQGRRIYDHLREVGARDVLEIGTAFGVSAGYMAAAVAANGGGRVTTVDRYQFARARALVRRLRAMR
jgi:predicted O-methyltransferase YrrM